MRPAAILGEVKNAMSVHTLAPSTAETVRTTAEEGRFALLSTWKATELINHVELEALAIPTLSNPKALVILDTATAFSLNNMSVFDRTFDATFAYQTPVTVLVRGSGIINGVGTYPAGREVEIEAIPVSYMRFKHWVYEDQIIEDNPYQFIALEKEMNFIAQFYMTIEEYLKGMIGYPVSDASIYAAETNRSIVFGSDTAKRSQKGGKGICRA